MHYWGEDLNDNDEDRDMQLPFKKVDSHAPHLVFIPGERIFSTMSCPFDMQDPRVICYRTNLHANPALASLFRPPVA